MIAGLRATNEALMKQEAINNAQSLQTESAAGISIGSSEKKNTFLEFHDPLQAEYTKETTPSTGMFIV